MPAYDYYCKKCDLTREEIHQISENPEIRCFECGGLMIRVISFNMTGFIFKGGTPAINWKEKRYRLKKREKIGKKQRERYGTGPKIKPNIAGVETGSWSDAQKMAKEAGMNYESYTPWVEKEKKQRKKIIV